ncbi:DUF6318 family protein [Kocuria flava]|uniref:DUF6318 family protein n=1 Tax=Kocuria flava TaxID=446860 RepID=UPI001FF6050C|nr:DUF6318 family protein [Kocuria flava]MCJ8505158.1 DUF6318 family protein [Kocuria flava]
MPASLEGPARNVPEPVMPALAKEESLEGAQAFLDYWSDAMWFAYQTGDTSYARDIISPHCEACLEELDAVESVYIDDLWMTGGRPSIQLSVDELVLAQDGVYKPLAKYSGEGGKLIDDGVMVEENAPTSDESTLVYLGFDDTGWVYITMAPVAGE